MQLKWPRVSRQNPLPYLNDQFEAHTLGQTSKEIDVKDIDTLKDITLDMAQQSHRLIQIISRHLDAQIYDDNDFITALIKLVRDGRRSEIQILTHDSMPAVKSSHSLIDLHQRLSSHIHIRQIHNDHKNFNQALFLVDEIAYIYRPLSDRFEAKANYNNALQSKQYINLFNEIWQISEPDPQVRRLNL